MQLGFATVHVIARSVVTKQSLKRDCFAFPFALLRASTRNNKETLFSLHPKSQPLKLIADLRRSGLLDGREGI